MSSSQQKLVLQKPRYGRGESRYVFENREESFPYEAWAPAIADLINADTVARQKNALSKAIFSVAAAYDGLRHASRGRLAPAAPLSHRIDARFRFDDNEPSLTYVRVLGGAAIGYQAPDDKNPYPPFAVIDLRQTGEEPYHRVARGPAEVLGGIEVGLNMDVADTLANRLHDIYPGLEILQKINDELALSKSE